jgi:phosphate transport system protein
MGRLAVAIAENTGHAIRTRDVELAAELARDDDAMDDLHRHIFTVLTAPQWSYGVSCAVDITLLARFYERYAVTVARRIVYLVTGALPDLCPPPRPRPSSGRGSRI